MRITPSLDCRRQGVAFLLVGCLSMLYAELFSGASSLWFLDAWSILVTFPLYMVHVIFFLNMALRTARTSPVHLYLWGMLFAMYESWITQVLWVGYTVNQPLFGTLGGIAIGEFLGLVLFWHPVMSFVVPLIIFEVLVLSISIDNPENRILPSHVPLLIATPRNRKILGFLYILGSIFMTISYQGNILLGLAVLGGTYGIIYGLYRKAIAYQVTIHSLRVGKRGFAFALGYLLLLYTAMFFGYGYQHGRISGPLPIATTVFLYIVFMWLILSSRPAEESVEIPSSLIGRRISSRMLRTAIILQLILICGLGIVYSAVPFVAQGAFLILYVLICGVGIYLFMKAIRLRNSQTENFLKHTLTQLSES
ncbi:MAG: hypothetical protein HXS52_06485 [Theionarchaea archaeon]|nr:hypothetical protein [Theionarchaea archaeon]MBU7037560.1 hypothetical protein [Theionarchaea archaeon]